MSGFGGGGNPCTVCGKTAYPAETVSFEKKPYHVECFRCVDCSKKVTVSNCGGFEDKIYCKQCFAKGGFAQKQRNVKWVKKESSGGSSGIASKFGGGGNPCTICTKTVYPAEAVSYEKQIYHGECFKCTTCTKKVTPSGAASFENAIYCKKCFADGGFAQKQRNVKWEKKESSGNAIASKFGGGGNKCEICAKTVYPAETVSYEKKAYHQECFKCSKCTKKITPSGAAKFEEDGAEKLFCTKCFQEGGYNKKQAQVTKSSGAPKTYDSRFAKFGGGGNKCKKCDKTVFPAEQISFEKTIFHQACFVCSWETCSKGGKAISVSDAQYTKDAATGDITVYCRKCFGENRLGAA
jgi:cysteine/glycine-rich protein